MKDCYYHLGNIPAYMFREWIKNGEMIAWDKKVLHICKINTSKLNLLCLWVFSIYCVYLNVYLALILIFFPTKGFHLRNKRRTLYQSGVDLSNDDITSFEEILDRVSIPNSTSLVTADPTPNCSFLYFDLETTILVSY